MDIKANKVDSMPRSISTKDLIADEWNQIVYENNAILAKGDITPSSSNTTQLLSAINNIAKDKINITMADYYSNINEIWQQPSDWINIRSAAISNSVYFLVGHKSDYSQYRYFGFNVIISNSGTYDVFIDGLKYTTSNSDTATTIDWQTLALQSGWDTVYPEALHTHIIRITPTVDTDTITAIYPYYAANLGLLWAHFNIKNAINISKFLYNSDLNPVMHCYLCQAITSNNVLKLQGSMTDAFRDNKLNFLSILDLNNSSIDFSQAFADSDSKLKYIKIKNGTISGNYIFNQAHMLESIITENVTIIGNNYNFNSAYRLKQLPSIIDFSSSTDLYPFLTEDSNLTNTVIDLSNNTTITRLGIYGSPTYPMYGLKVLILSNYAPFNSVNSPQLNIAYTGLNRYALINLFNSMPTVSSSQVCNIKGCIGTKDLTTEDIAIATNKGWTVNK